jgi:hypothetical protein
MDALSEKDWEAYLSGTTAQPDRTALQSTAFWQKELGMATPPTDFQEPEEPSSAIAIAEAALVKDPTKKIEIYAQQRGLDPSQYKVVDGEIVFEQDGKWYRESESGPWARRFAIQTLTDLPTIGATAGGIATGLVPGIGPATISTGALLGGIGGEYVRQQLAEKLYGEELTPRQMGFELAREAGEGVVGEGLGKIASKGLVAAGRGIGKLAGIKTATPPIGKVLETNELLKKSNIRYVHQIQNKAKEYGVPLNLVESVEYPLNIRDLAEFAKDDATMAIDRSRMIKDRVPEFIKGVFPSWRKSFTERPATGEVQKFQNIIKDQLKGLSKERKAIVSPLYKAAYDSNPEASTEPLVEFLDELIGTSIKSTAEKLKKELRKDLFTGQGKKKKAVLSLEQLDELKRKVDGLIERGGDAEWTAAKIKIKRFKDRLLDYTDFEISPQYTIARATHALLKKGEKMTAFGRKAGLPDETIKKYIKKQEKAAFAETALEPIADLPEKSLKDIGAYVLASKNTTPAMVSQVKQAISQSEGGDRLWESAIGDFLEYTANQIPVSPKGALDFGRMWWKSTMGNESKKEVLKAALDDTQYKALSNMMDVFRRTGIVFGGKTLPKKELEIPTHKLLEAGRKGALPLFGVRAVITRKILKKAQEQDLKSLMDIIYDPDVANRLANIKISESTTKVLNQFLRIVGWGTATEASRELTGTPG